MNLCHIEGLLVVAGRDGGGRAVADGGRVRRGGRETHLEARELAVRPRRRRGPARRSSTGRYTINTYLHPCVVMLCCGMDGIYGIVMNMECHYKSTLL